MSGEVQNLVQKFRMAAGLTQEQLAEKVGVSRQTIVAIEKGNYAPSVALALRLGKVFKTSVESIFSIT